jgi:DNA-binding XRE family transcriptional regulator
MAREAGWEKVQGKQNTIYRWYNLAMAICYPVPVSPVTAQIQKSFGECLRAERKKRELTQAEVAERAGISLNYEGDLERGLKMPSLEAVIRLAKALDLTVAQFMEKGGF